MEIRCKSGSLLYYERILDTAVSQEDTREVIVPDSLPDAAEILETGGQTLIRGKDVRLSGVAVSGLSELTVLYRTEDGALGRLPVDIPFETEVACEAPGDQVRIVAAVRLVSGDARLFNSRKLAVRAEVCVSVAVWIPKKLEWAEEAEAEGCSLELRRETRTVWPCLEVDERTFTAEDSQPLPGGKLPAESILSVRASLREEEASPVGRKLVVRGDALVTVVYLTEGGEVAQADFRLPWSAFLELPEEGETDYSLTTALTGCSVELGDGGFSFTVGGVVQAAIRVRRELGFISDAYGTDFLFRPVFETSVLEGETCRDSGTDTLSVRLESLRKPRSFLDLFAECGRPRQDQDAVRVSVAVKALCVMEDESMELLTGRGEAVFPGTGGVPEVSCGELYASVTAAGAEVRVPIRFRRTGSKEENLTFLTGGTAEEAGETKRGPTVFLLRAEKGDTVWSLGKRKNVPCAAIRAYNHLEEGEEVTPGMLLLLAR